jgi:hypothetical protein
MPTPIEALPDGAIPRPTHSPAVSAFTSQPGVNSRLNLRQYRRPRRARSYAVIAGTAVWDRVPCRVGPGLAQSPSTLTRRFD